MLERLAERIELGHQQRSAAGDVRAADHAVRRRLRAVRGAERVHDEDLAEHGVALGEGGVVLFLADIEPAVLEQHDFARFDVDRLAVQIIAQQTHGLAERMAEPGGDRRERFVFAEMAFLRPAEVRHDHHTRARVARELDRRQRGFQTLARADLAVLERHVEVFAYQHALALEIEFGHAEYGHARFLLGS